MTNNNFDNGSVSNENTVLLKQTDIVLMNKQDSLAVAINKLNALSQEITNEVLQPSDYHFNPDSTSSGYIQLERYVELSDSYYELQKKFIRLQGNVLDQIPALRDILLSIGSTKMQFSLELKRLTSELTREKEKYEPTISNLKNEIARLQQEKADIKNTGCVTVTLFILSVLLFFVTLAFWLV